MTSAEKEADEAVCAKNERKERKCLMCSEVFWVRRYNQKKLYCDTDCRAAYHRRVKRGTVRHVH